MKTRTLVRHRLGTLMLLTLLISYAFISLTRSCFNAAMASIVQLGVFTKTQTGIISAVFYAFYGVLQVVGGIVIDRRKPEHFITIGFIGAAISNFIIYFNQDYTVILCAWAFNAIAQFAVWPAIFKLLSTMLPRDMRTNALFATTFVNPAGVVASFLVAAIVGSRWQMNFLISAIGLTVFAIVWEWVLHLIKPHIWETEHAPAIKPDAVKDTPKDASKDTSFLHIILTSGLVLAFMVAFCRSTSDASIRNLTSTMLNETYDSLNPRLSNLLSIIVLVCGTVGTTVARMLYPKVIRNESVAMTIFLGAAFPVSCGLLLLGKVHYVWMIVLLGILALLLGATTIFTMTYLAARFGKWGKGATVAGALNCTACIGTVVANSVSPMLADAFSWRVVTLFWIVLLAVTLLFVIVFVPIWTRFWKKQEQ